MSKIPENIKIAINDYASGRADKPNVIKHAEFGYSLSLERIGELEKEVKALCTDLNRLKKAATGFAEWIDDSPYYKFGMYDWKHVERSQPGITTSQLLEKYLLHLETINKEKP